MAFKIQWGSEIRTGRDFEWSKRGRVANGVDFEQNLKSGSPTNQNLDSSRHFVKNHLKSGQKCPHFEWSGFQMVGTIAIAIAKAQPDHLKSNLQKVWISNVSGFQLVGFQILTVSNGRPFQIRPQKSLDFEGWYSDSQI